MGEFVFLYKKNVTQQISFCASCIFFVLARKDLAASSGLSITHDYAQKMGSKIAAIFVAIFQFDALFSSPWKKERKMCLETVVPHGP